MRYLLDTHALLWWMLDDPKLPAHCAGIVNDQQNEIALSVVSAYEIRFKAAKGLLPGGEKFGDMLADLASRAQIAVLPVTLEHSMLAGSFAMFHRDPFDRFIAAQAIIGDFTLLSSDEVLEGFGAKRMW